MVENRALINNVVSNLPQTDNFDPKLYYNRLLNRSRQQILQRQFRTTPISPSLRDSCSSRTSSGSPKSSLGTKFGPSPRPSLSPRSTWPIHSKLKSLFNSKITRRTIRVDNQHRPSLSSTLSLSSKLQSLRAPSTRAAGARANTACSSRP